jgi:intracellular septation protein
MMKLLFDLFPVILFFIAFKFSEGRKEAAAQWLDTLFAGLGLVVVLGGLTLVLRDETFIKWKPTMLYWIFAVALLVSTTLFRKNLIRSMLEAQVSLPEPVWGRLNLLWAGFFVFMGAANLFIASRYPTDVWVNFKLFGGMGLMLAFMVAQGFWLSRYMEEPADEKSEEKS